MTSRQIVHATVFEFGYRHSITLTGQTAKTLLALVEAGPRVVVYDLRDLESWLTARKRTSTSDTGGTGLSPT